mmetsp:Transcript_18557/g.25734  ORF Transcript_18557/g.25734 Transcript_18557/m.25734 type:complete len:362 (+) Transcript_18557:133-1218(+)
MKAQEHQTNRNSQRHHQRLQLLSKNTNTCIPLLAISVVLGLLGDYSVSSFTFVRPPQQFAPSRHAATIKLFVASRIPDQPFVGNDNSDDYYDGDDTEWLNAELVDDAEFYDNMNGDSEDDWMSDREKARTSSQQFYANAAHYSSQTLEADDFVSAERASRRAQQQPRQPKGAATAPAQKQPKFDKGEKEPQQETKAKVYTQEEEELIAAMGGNATPKDDTDSKSSSSTTIQSKREPGFLGDCTLTEITMDYSVPICYIADVLCMWGVPVPINPQEKLGDLVTGEQAFALLEAVYSLDISALHDRYSNMNLMSVCDWYDIDIKDAFEFSVKEGWSLPFGVQTCLRVEQEDELVRVLGGHDMV